MRRPRIKGPPGLRYYHCISRVVDRRRVLGDAEREHFVALVRKLEGFCGLRAVTYCVMSNHFHLLMEVPRRAAGGEPGSDEVLRRLGFLYDRATVGAVRLELEQAAAAGDRRWEEEILGATAPAWATSPSS